MSFCLVLSTVSDTAGVETSSQTEDETKPLPMDIAETSASTPVSLQTSASTIEDVITTPVPDVADSSLEQANTEMLKDERALASNDEVATSHTQMSTSNTRQHSPQESDPTETLSLPNSTEAVKVSEVKVETEREAVQDDNTENLAPESETKSADASSEPVRSSTLERILDRSPSSTPPTLLSREQFNTPTPQESRMQMIVESPNVIKAPPKPKPKRKPAKKRKKPTKLTPEERERRKVVEEVRNRETDEMEKHRLEMLDSMEKIKKEFSEAKEKFYQDQMKSLQEEIEDIKLGHLMKNLEVLTFCKELMQLFWRS